MIVHEIWKVEKKWEIQNIFMSDGGSKDFIFRENFQIDNVPADACVWSLSNIIVIFTSSCFPQGEGEW